MTIPSAAMAIAGAGVSLVLPVRNSQAASAMQIMPMINLPFLNCSSG